MVHLLKAFARKGCASGADIDRLKGLTEDDQNLRNSLKTETLFYYEICPFEMIVSSVS